MGGNLGSLANDAYEIINSAIREMLPNSAVKKALSDKGFKNGVYVVAIGKAAYEMARAASEILKEQVIRGIVITKYEHSKGKLEKFEIYEAGHPVPDENTIKASEKVVEMVGNLKETDEVLFLISGGGSALFEIPAEGLMLSDIEAVTRKLLACGCDIVEINAVRKRLSKVKGGRFAEIIYPAKIFSIVLSDVIGDRPDTIASGPAYPDGVSTDEVLNILEKYKIELDEKIMDRIHTETPKEAANAQTIITGSVVKLCEETARLAENLGYTPVILTTNLNCEAREAGKFLASIAKDIQNGNSFKKPCAVIAGGETVVTLKGNGLGGRNQELALAAAEEISGMENTVIFSIGSDGTDGPTNAAGGIVDGKTKEALQAKGIKISDALANNDAYNALAACDSLIITGPTGTNVNDVSVVLCK